MARVFLANQNSLDCDVALKVLNESLAHDPTFRDRFLAEGKDTAKFTHPGIVSIKDAGVEGNNYYLVLEYLGSGSLKDRQLARLQNKNETQGKTNPVFDPEESLALIAELADALDYAHSKNVVHRDIKPANILFRSDGRAVLSDFGIAKSVTENRELTMTGYMVGTPAYMSPEQKLGASIDARSDLYSLGVIFFELLTGKKPYLTQSGNYAELRKELDADIPLLPVSLAYLQPLLNKLLAKDPLDRFKSAGELRNSINRLVNGRTGVGEATVLQAPAIPMNRQKPIGRKVRGRRFLYMAFVSILTIGLLALAAAKLLPEQTPAVTPVSAETAKEIEGLLTTANIFVQMDQLIDAGPSNAVAVYTRVLEMQPGNPEAMAGRDTALAQIIEQIQGQLESGDREGAVSLINIAEFYYPDNKELAKLNMLVSN